MSISLHLLSPMSKGLFHRAIIMSGSALSQWDIPSEQTELAKKYAHLLGCKHETIDDVLICLKSVTDIHSQF